MGRVTNKKKFKSAKSSIIAYDLESEDEIDNITDSQARSLRSSDVLPVIKQLSSADSTERAWAASCASNLIAGEEKIRRLLLSKNLIRLLIERLTDDVYEVVYECVGTLRNLTVIGEYEICAEMFNKDILTPLTMLISKISIIIDNLLKGISDESDPIEGTRKNIWIFTENIICILWALSETSQKVLRRINNMNVVPFLMAFFTQIEKIPSKTVVAAAQCLHTITDDNSDIHSQFEQNPQYLQVLMNVINLTSTNLNDNYFLIKVLCCGVILNLNSIIVPPVSRTDFNMCINNYLKSCLNYDIENAANEAKELASNIKIPNFATKHPRDDLPTVEEDKLIGINLKLTTLQLALELLSKFWLECFSQDDDNLQDEMQSDDETETKFNDSFKENKIMDTDDLMSNAYDQSLLNGPGHPILNTFDTDIIPDLIRLSRPTSISYPEQLGHNVIPAESVVPTITASLATVHLRAVECMNNFFLTIIDIVDEKWFTKHRDAAKHTWTRLVEVANQVAGKGVKVGAEDPGQKMRGTVLEALVGCLWTLARGLNGDLPLAENQIQAFIQCYKSTVSESMHVKLIGTLGTIARRQNAIEDNKLIGTFLIEIIRDLPRVDSLSVDCIAESLNAIYDVYADINFDYNEPVFVREGYLHVLESIVNDVHNIAKSIDKQKSREQRLRMDEVYINLVAFIKYKKDEQFTT